MNAPTSTVGSSPAATSRWPRRAVVVDLPWVPVTPRPMRPGAACSSPSSACQVATGIPARRRPPRARRDRARRERRARWRRGRRPRGGPDRARPPCAMPAASSGGVYGDGAVGVAAVDDRAGAVEEQGGARRSGAGDADDVDPLARARPLPYPSDARRAPSSMAASADARLLPVTVVRPGVALDDGRPVAERGRHVGQPDRLVGRSPIRARRCRSPRRPGVATGNRASAPEVIASATSAETAPTLVDELAGDARGAPP